MKIAIIRAASVNDWELQSYAPLAKKYDLIVFGSWSNAYPYTLSLPVKKFFVAGRIAGFFPGGIRWLYSHYGDPQLIFGLEQTLKGFDIAHAVERTNYYTLQAARARQKGFIKKLVVHCWENLPHFKEKTPVQKAMKAEVDRTADLFLAGTQGARKILLSEGISAKKIMVIPFGIDTERFTLPKKPIIKDITVLFAARMTVGKGVYVLLAAVEYLIKLLKKKDLTFVFMGEGSEKEMLKSLIQEKNLAQFVSIKDVVPYQTLQSWYQRAEILVLPSLKTPDWQEQFGLVLTECMASGTPVIGSDVGSIPEIISGAGLTFPAGEYKQLANLIIKLHKNKRLQKQLSRKGRARVMKYYSTAVVSKLLDKAYIKVMKPAV